MRRRPYLAGLVVYVLVGCLGLGYGSGPTRTDQYRLAIDAVEAQTFSLRLNDLGGDVGAPSPSLDGLEDNQRAVVEKAIEDEYETDEPEPWLREFLDETPYVEADGTFYALEHSFPVHVVTADPVDPGDVDGEIASQSEYREAVTLKHVVFSGFLRVANEEGYRSVDFHPQLRAFVEEYEAVEYHGETFRIEYEVAESGPPYRVWAELAADSDIYDGPVIDIDEMDPEYRDPVREAAATTGLYGVDDPPDGLAELIEDHRYVHIDGTYYAAYASDSSAVDVRFDAILLDDTTDADSPAELQLVLENGGEEEIEVMSGAPPPFGVQYMYRHDDSDERVLLWSDEYEDSSHVHTEGRTVVGVNAIGLVTRASPGETLRQTFEIDAGRLAAGSYELSDSVEVNREPDGGSLPYTVTFTIERSDG